MDDENSAQGQEPRRDESKPGAAVATAVLAVSLAVEPLAFYVLQHEVDPSRAPSVHTHQDPPPANRDHGLIELVMGDVSTLAASASLSRIDSMDGYAIVTTRPEA